MQNLDDVLDRDVIDQKVNDYGQSLVVFLYKRICAFLMEALTTVLIIIHVCPIKADW